MKKLLLPITCMSILCCMLSIESRSQTFEEYKKQQEKERQAFIEKEKAQFEEFRQERDEAIRKMDEDFREYLSREWENFELFKAQHRDMTPKPLKIPAFTEPEIPDPIEIPVKIKETDEKTINSPRLPVMQKSSPEKYPTTEIICWFYGLNIGFQYDHEFVNTFKADISEKTISEKWEIMGQTHYNDLITQLQQVKHELNLNDWGYYMLIKETVAQIAIDESASVFLTWFLLTKSNYKAKLAFKDSKLFLLIPTGNTIYGRPYFQFGNLNYYLMEGNQTDLYTYQEDFPEAMIVMDLNLYKAINLPENKKTKALNFTFNEQKYTFNISYNQNAIDFYSDYPLAEIKVYFDAAMPRLTRESLSDELLPVVENMTEVEAVSFLLRLVQTSFGYQTDQEQFGYEKFFFPDELFHFANSDCEDRSVLFTYLVTQLLNLDVVGLEYPGHMAAAVNFTSDVSGDYILHHNKKYIVCDPTYIMAPVGKTMPVHAKTSPKIVMLSQSQESHSLARVIWEQANKKQLFQGSGIQNFTFDSEGNIYICGYFSGTTEFQDHRISSVQNSNDVFLLKVNKDKEVQYLKTFGGPGNDMAYHIQLDPADNIYLTGIFSGQVKAESGTITTANNSDIFLTSYNKQGGQRWISQANLSGNDQLNDTYVVHFNERGKKQWIKTYAESEDYGYYGLLVETDGKTYLTGSVSVSTGMDIAVKDYASTASFDNLDALKFENDKLLANDYNEGIAGLFTVIRMIQKSGNTLPGREAQMALDKYNPGFKSKSSEIYKNIGRIEFIKNSDGVVNVRTYDGKDVNFNAIRIKNNSKLKISMFKSGNAQINILSGVKVGKAVVWYDLNHVKLFKTSGDLIFDYNSDHSQKKVNMEKDIL